MFLDHLDLGGGEHAAGWLPSAFGEVLEEFGVEVDPVVKDAAGGLYGDVRVITNG